MKYPEDIRAEYISFGDAADMLQNGTIDGAWIMSGAPAAAVSQALSSGCQLVNITDDVIASLQKTYPWYAKFTIPAGTYQLFQMSPSTQTYAGFYCIYHNIDSGLLDIVKNGFFDYSGSKSITVKEGQILELNYGYMKAVS